jgi:hypothetical protein
VIVPEDEMVIISSEVEGLCVAAGELDVELTTADTGELDTVVGIVTLSVEVRVEVAGATEDESGGLVVSTSSVQVV